MPNFQTLALGILISLFVIAPGYAAEIVLDESDFPLLTGVWDGERFNTRAGGKKAGLGIIERYELNIKKGGKGNFTNLKSGKKWKSPVKIKNGKVMLNFSGEKRLFTYSEDAGKQQLSVKFEYKFQGALYDADVLLLKR
jgi:hypothetical protein